MYQNFIIPYLYEAQHVSGDTPPIIRSLKLHWQLLNFIRGNLLGRVVQELQPHGEKTQSQEEIAHGGGAPGSNM